MHKTTALHNLNKSTDVPKTEKGVVIMKSNNNNQHKTDNEENKKISGKGLENHRKTGYWKHRKTNYGRITNN